MKLIIPIGPKKIGAVLMGISLYLCVQSVVFKGLEYAADVHSTYLLYHLSAMLNVNREGNIPTLYSTLLLLACAVLLAVVAYRQRLTQARDTRHWIGLSLIFLLLTADEAAAIHEKFTIPIQEVFDPGGYLHFGWVLIGAVFVAGVGLVYGRFLWRLPPRTRRLTVMAALCYIGGALIIEAISANQWYLDDGTSFIYSVIGTIEEFLEMTGMVIFIYALLTHLDLKAIEFISQAPPDS